MRGVDIPGFLGGDRTSLDLPEPQERILKAVIATGKPVVVVLTSGSAISANFAAEHATAVLKAWSGGEEAGTAIAETLAGVNNPAGRLPVTFYKGVDQLPSFTDYAMKGRTYRYFKGEPLYTFGFGLSYSSFEYAALSAKRTPKGAEVRATVKNTSARDGDEVVQLYVAGGTGEAAPVRTLRGFQRVHLRAGESREVSFTLRSDDLPESKVEISVGGGQPLGAHRMSRASCSDQGPAMPAEANDSRRRRSRRRSEGRRGMLMRPRAAAVAAFAAACLGGSGAAIGAPAIVAPAAVQRIASPDAHLQATITIADDVRYALTLDGTPLVLPSAVSLSLADRAGARPRRQDRPGGPARDLRGDPDADRQAGEE